MNKKTSIALGWAVLFLSALPAGAQTQSVARVWNEAILDAIDGLELQAREHIAQATGSTDA